MKFKEELLLKYVAGGTSRKPSEMCFCNLCLRFMAQRDGRWHRNCYEVKNKMSLLNDKMSKCVAMCQKVTLYIMWYLRPILSKDIAKLIAKMVYETKHNMFLWYPVILRSTLRHRKIKNKKIKHLKWNNEVL